MEVNIHMAKTKIEVNKNVIPVVEKIEPKTRGRQKGVSVGERQKSYIYITEEIRIDISDGLNKTVQKYTTKNRGNDGQSEDGTEKWNAGDTYQEWSNVDRCYCSSFKSAFDRVLDLMVEDGVKVRERVSVEEFLKLYKEKNDLLSKIFNTMFDEEQNIKDKKKIKGE
jgi:hypothetical protein